MGRHSASGISAQHGRPAGSTSVAAAKYVGCVGAIAFALGVGAAVAGGTGLANAEGTAENRASGVDAKSSSAPKADRGPVDIGGRRAAVKTRTPRLSDGPRKVLGIGADSVGRAAGQPRERAAAVVKAAATERPDVATLGRAATERVDAVDSFARVKVDEVAAAFRGGDRTLGVAPTRSRAPQLPSALGALQLIRREVDQLSVRQVPSTASFTAAENYANAHPANAIEAPNPDDQVSTAYGNIGKWMLQPNGEIADYGGQPYNGKVLLEPVNVIIVDPKSKSPEEATRRLNSAMFWAGFPAQPVHSTGFQGSIDDVTYGQQPTTLLSGYSDNLFILPNNHGRVFGPDPVETSAGYVWSGAFSTEQFGIYQLVPTHTYVSSDMARTALALRLILSGQATFVGMVPLHNAVNNETTTTGDHDGYAVVLQLR